jgi:hypothetical protein
VAVVVAFTAPVAAACVIASHGFVSSTFTGSFSAALSIHAFNPRDACSNGFNAGDSVFNSPAPAQAASPCPTPLAGSAHGVSKVAGSSQAAAHHKAPVILAGSAQTPAFAQPKSAEPCSFLGLFIPAIAHAVNADIISLLLVNRR